MRALLEIATVLLVAVSMALALAHALELPGKLRLDRDTYHAVQTIYYPGFTIGGISEPLAILGTITLLVFSPGGSAFVLTLAALVLLVAMQAAYWLITHPVNRFWLEGQDLRAAARAFFASDPLVRGKSGADAAWTRLRDRWEYSHVARAAFALLALIALLDALFSSPCKP